MLYKLKIKRITMEEKSIDITLRQNAIDWLNSKSRNVEQALAILKQANYKPFVISIFEKNKSRRDIPTKVLSEMRLYIRYCSNPNADNPIHDDEQPINNPEEKLEQNIDKLLANDYPPIVKKLLEECSNLYKGRSIMHKQLKDVGESNDNDSIHERKRISAIIEASSRRMDTLWEAFEAYRSKGIVPEESLFTEPFDPEKEEEDEIDTAEENNQSPTLTLPNDIDKLKKMSENWRTKISKAENRLEFQQDTRADKPNPMPEGAKRITQEKRIAKLKAEKEAIDLKIAESI